MNTPFIVSDVSDEIVSHDAHPVEATIDTTDTDDDTFERPTEHEVTEAIAGLKELTGTMVEQADAMSANALSNARALWMSGRATIVDTLDCLGLTVRSFAQYVGFPRTRLEKIIDSPGKITDAEMKILCDAIIVRGSTRADRDAMRMANERSPVSCRKSWTYDRDRRYTNKKIRGLK